MSNYRNKKNTQQPVQRPTSTGHRIATLRQDVIPIMQKICKSGFQFDADKSHKDGWYGDYADWYDITPAEAYDLFSLHNYDKNRKIQEEWAYDLASNVQEALQIAIGITDDMYPVILNGQHTLYAIYLKDQVTRCQFTIYQCRDKEAMANLYACFDANKKKTSTQVMAAQFNAGVFDLNITPAKLNKWATVTILAKNGFKRDHSSTSNSARIAVAKEDEVQNFALFMDRLTTGINQQMVKTLIPQGVGAAIYAMFLADQNKTEEFLLKYLGGANLDEIHPCLKLREWMMTRNRNTHGDMNIPFFAGLVYTSWRKFCLGETIAVLKQTKSVPEYNKWKISYVKGQMSEQTAELATA